MQALTQFRRQIAGRHHLVAEAGVASLHRDLAGMQQAEGGWHLQVRHVGVPFPFTEEPGIDRLRFQCLRVEVADGADVGIDAPGTERGLLIGDGELLLLL